MATLQLNSVGFIPTPHPLLRLPTADEIEEILAGPDGREALRQWYEAREARIREAEADPMAHGFELGHWADADRCMNECDILYVGGGKRAGKSEWAAKRFVASCLAYGESIRWAFQDNETTSVSTQQPLVWKYLPVTIKALNERKSSRFKIKYQEGRGFTENLLVLPNRTQINFLTYKQDPEGFTGWELGARMADVAARDLSGSHIPNIGAWCDENLTMAWYLNIKLRLATRGAKCLWTFSPLHGITPTIKEFRGSAKTLSSKPAELLQGTKNVDDCPPGEMPYIQKPATPGGGIIYFFSDANPFGNYPVIKKRLEARPSREIKRDAYGYAEDTISRAFPKFGTVNIVRAQDLPAEGTNYLITDPAGARNWFTIWWRVCPGNPPTHFIYREWPDVGRYGEWAVPSQHPGKFDGDPGPAQPTLGYGPAEYKRIVFGAVERIEFHTNGHTTLPMAESETRLALISDPLRRAVVRAAWVAGLPLKDLAEPVRLRLIDPRAGRNQTAAERGGTCVIDKLAERNIDTKTGVELAPPMFFHPASGISVEEGVAMINELLYWDSDREFDPILNSPRLFVEESCFNVRWALENWTGSDGEHGACKDVIDTIRYAATSDLRHIAPGQLAVTGGGSY